MVKKRKKPNKTKRIERTVSTTMRLPADSLEWFKKNGHSITRFVSRQMRDAATAEGSEEVIMFKISDLNERIEELEVDIARRKRATRTLVKEKESIIYELYRMEEQEEIIQKANERSRLTGALTKLVIEYNYNIVMIEENCGEIIKEISKVNKNFDLQAYVNRMKEIFK